MRKYLSCLCVAVVLALGAGAPASAAVKSDGPPTAHSGLAQARDVSATVEGGLSGTPVGTDAVTAAAGDVSASAVVLFNSDFETGGTWYVTGSPANWGLTPYRKSNGAMSMYCAQAGRPAPGPYANDTETWMVAGPFNLSGYSSAVLNFDIWMQTEGDFFDYVFVGASTDAANFNGDAWSGDSGGWQNVSLDISEYARQSNVYIGFEFGSDDSVVYEGVYIDRVALYAQPSATPPVAAPDMYSVSSGKLRQVHAPGVLANDTDADGETLHAFADTMPSGVLHLNSDGSFTYQSPPAFTGATSFTYHASDGQYSSPPVTVTLVVMPDLPPTAVGDSYMMIKNTPRTVPWPGVLANDSDPYGDTLEPMTVDPPLHGDLIMLLSGAFQYTPDTGYTGPDSFTYRVYDGAFYSDTVTVDLTVAESPPISVYRFYNWRMGTHFYTANETEKQNVINQLSGTYTFEGPAYTLQPANNSTPLYRFFKPSSGTHFYTASEMEKNHVVFTLSHTYTYEGVAYNVSSDSWAGSNPAVHRFFKPSTGTHFYTANITEMNTVRNTMSHIYSYDGPAFYLGQ